MTGRVYPLNSLRAFEVSARYLSFVKAGMELNVTPAAISHQVKKLEQYLGTRLFWRMPKGLLLTEAGQRFLPELSEGFLKLDRAVERVRDIDVSGPLTISVAPVFAAKWLVPRLCQFNELHPDIDVRISSSLQLIDFERDAFDAAIRLGSGHYPGLITNKLFDESVTPMCSPRLLNGKQPLNHPDDLCHQVLLHDDSLDFDDEAPRWTRWLSEAGANEVDASRGVHFSHPDHSLQAAIDATGVTLGWRFLAAEDLAAGRLVAPFDLVLPLNMGFYLVYPESHAVWPRLQSFTDWLLTEIKITH
jgi:LysR family transcriptional regulator, glycine cleavage system transcriptional activator